MARAQLLRGNKDFEALGNLVLALESVAAVDLDHYADPATEVDLHSILDDLRIVIAPAVEEDSIQLSWNLHPALPAIRADRNKLMQIFLNLTNNAIRALGRTPDGNRSLVLSTELLPGSVAVQFLDNAGGVAHPAELFHPFQAGAHATGLGLYLSRAFARSFGGDLRYTSSPGSALFTVVLPIAEPPSQAHSV
jgi:signal transduction histidine kinase